MPGTYSALGGNAPVMASRFAKEGAKVLLAAKRSPYIINEIHPNVIGKPFDNLADRYIIRLSFCGFIGQRTKQII